MIRALLLMMLFLVSLQAQAHPLAPALLQVQQKSVDEYQVLWRTSISRVQGADVAPAFPPQCVHTNDSQTAIEEGEALVARWSIRCAVPGLYGSSLVIQGLERAGINVIVRIEDLKGETSETLLDARQASFTIPTPEAAPPVFGSYLHLGVEHLLTGFDHMLFVAGLFLLVRRIKPLLVTVTAFTFGHSITLALASLGVIHVNSALTEFGIALSILILACEVVRNDKWLIASAGHAPPPAPTALRADTVSTAPLEVVRKDKNPSWLARKPWLMASSFGLLHGLGFAGALAEVGLPQGEIPLALFAFNIGIELGQIMLVAGLIVLAALWQRLPSFRTTLRLRPLITALPSYVIGSLAAYWCLQRAAVLLG